MYYINVSKILFYSLFQLMADSFMSNIGSRYGITAGSRENTLYNALWVAQALLRKGYVHFPPFAFMQCHSLINLVGY